MDIVAKFDPSAKTTDTFATNLSNGIGKIIIWNESNWTLDITFTDGSMDLAPAWTATIFELTGPAGKITWTQDTQLAANIPPISKVWVVAYRDSEPIPGVFPLALVRQTNIGNASTVMAATTSIQNDGNIAGTSLVESTVGADLSSAITWSNDAVLVNGNATRPGSVAFDNSKISSDGSGNLTMVKALLTTGSLSRMAVAGPYAVDPVAAFVNHDLGATPDFVWAISGAITAVAISITADFATMTSTQVKLQSNTHLSTVYILSIKL
jgi:hypothetical protein